MARLVLHSGFRGHVVTDKESRALPWALTHPPSCCPPAEWGKLDGEETETQLSSDGVPTCVPDLRLASRLAFPVSRLCLYLSVSNWHQHLQKETTSSPRPQTWGHPSQEVHPPNQARKVWHPGEILIPPQPHLRGHHPPILLLSPSVPGPRPTLLFTDRS